MDNDTTKKQKILKEIFKEESKMKINKDKENKDNHHPKKHSIKGMSKRRKNQLVEETEAFNNSFQSLEDSTENKFSTRDVQSVNGNNDLNKNIIILKNRDIPNHHHHNNTNENENEDEDGLQENHSQFSIESISLDDSNILNNIRPNKSNYEIKNFVNNDMSENQMNLYDNNDIINSVDSQYSFVPIAKNNSYNSSRRSSITVDSCKTMNNDSDIEGNDPNFNRNEKDRENPIYEHATVISPANPIYSNPTNNGIIMDEMDDEITLIKKANHYNEKIKDSNIKDLLNKDSANPNNHHHNSSFDKDSLLKETAYLCSEPIPSDPNSVNLNNIYTINTAIINSDNKQNLENSSPNDDLLNSPENPLTHHTSSNSNDINDINDINGNINNINSNTDTNNIHLDNKSNSNVKLNKEETRSYSCGSINTLNNNMKYMKTNDLLGNGHLKGYNQRFGSYSNLMNPSEGKTNNIITKKAILNNALKNNNVGLIYTKRHNSTSNINKLKLNINNAILLQSTSPKSAKSAHSNKSFEDSPIASPLTPTMKRINSYKYNDLLMAHRANSLKKDGMSMPLENHRSINNAHSFNNSSSTTSINSLNSITSLNSINSINSINSNNGGNNINMNKYPHFNIMSQNNDDFDLHTYNDNGNFSDNEKGNIQSRSIDLDMSNNKSSPPSDSSDSSKDWNIYQQFSKYINLDDLTFKNKYIAKEYDKMTSSLDETYWKNDIPMECSFFCIINIILNLFNNNLKSTKIQLLTTLIPVLVIFILFRVFHLNRHTKIKNFATILIFTLIGPVNYLITFFTGIVNNSYLTILFSLDLIIWIFAGHFVLHTSYKYTRYSILLCYLLCLIPYYYKLFNIDTSSFLSINTTSNSNGHIHSTVNGNDDVIYSFLDNSHPSTYTNTTIPKNYHNYSSSSSIHYSHSQIPFKHSHNYYPHSFDDISSSFKEALSSLSASYHQSNQNNILLSNQCIHSLFNQKNENNSPAVTAQDKLLVHEIQKLMDGGNSIYLYTNHTLIPLNPKQQNINSSKFNHHSNIESDTDTDTNKNTDTNTKPNSNSNPNININIDIDTKNHKDSNNNDDNQNIPSYSNREDQNLKDIINNYLSNSLTSNDISTTTTITAGITSTKNPSTSTSWSSSSSSSSSSNRKMENTEPESNETHLKSKSKTSFSSSPFNEFNGKKWFDVYELWVIVYDSPSQPLKLNNFIIKYYYEKTKMKNPSTPDTDSNSSNSHSSYHNIPLHRRDYDFNSSNDPNHTHHNDHDNSSYNEESIYDIIVFLCKNFVTAESLVYVLLLVSCYIIVKLIYELDVSLKFQFLNNCQYLQNNSILSLDSLQDDDLNRVVDFASPIEKVINIINQLLNQTDKESKNYELLNDALDHLNSSNLLLPDLERQLQDFVELEDEQKQWLLYEIDQQNYNYYYDDSDNSSENSPSSISSPYAFYELSSFDILSQLDNHTLQLLEKVKDYNFPIFEFCEATPRPLLTMSYHLFVKSGLISRLHLNTEKFLNFIKEIEENYHTDVTFHNACHATDVLHCMYYFSTIPNIGLNFKDWDLLGMFVAAAIHDCDHPGLNNKFLSQTMDPLAILYNDRSILENHHCATSFNILFKEKNNFMDHLDKEKFNEFREVVISLVLATDLAEHFQILSLFKKKISNISRCVQREDKILLMKILIKCADVSNGTKDRSIYKRWVDGVMEESYRQGDREKELNIPLSPFGNRDNARPNSCQKSFIEFIASPIFEVLADWVYTCQSKPDPEELNKSPTKSDTHGSTSSTKNSKRNSISSSNNSNSNSNDSTNINTSSNNNNNNNNNGGSNNSNSNSNSNQDISAENTNSISPTKLNKNRSSLLSALKLTELEDNNNNNSNNSNNNNNNSNSNTNATNNSTTPNSSSSNSNTNSNINDSTINNNNNNNNNNNTTLNYNDDNDNKFMNKNNLSLPSSPTMQERPLPGKKLSVGSLFKNELSNRLKNGSIKYKESTINLMIKRERDIESRKKMDVIMNKLQENRKWIENNGFGA